MCAAALMKKDIILPATGETANHIIVRLATDTGSAFLQWVS